MKYKVLNWGLITFSRDTKKPHGIIFSSFLKKEITASAGSVMSMRTIEIDSSIDLG